MGDYRRYVGLRLIVQLPEITLAGTLEREDKTTVTLADVTAVAQDGRERPVDGLVVVERSALSWLQVV